MNEIMNKFLLARDKFMAEMHLKQPGFAYSACGPFTKKQRKNWNVYANFRYVLFIKMNLIKYVFYMIWHMANQNIKQK